MNSKALTYSVIGVVLATGGFLFLANKRPASAVADAPKNPVTSSKIKMVEMMACGGREVFIFEIPESVDDENPASPRAVPFQLLSSASGLRLPRGHEARTRNGGVIADTAGSWIGCPT